jgi:hypothetical protein
MSNDDILDNEFHSCALHAYLEVWKASGQFPPDSEATRQRAYQLYEQALAEKNARKSVPQDEPGDPTRERGCIFEKPV